MTTMNEPRTAEELTDHYVIRVAQLLGFTPDNLPEYVRHRIEHCAMHQFSAEQAYYSTKDFLEGWR